MFRKKRMEKWREGCGRIAMLAALAERLEVAKYRASSETEWERPDQSAWGGDMTTFVLNSENLSSSIQSLIDRLGPGDSSGVPNVIQICDPTGKVVAYLSSPQAHERQLYDEAQAWAVANRAMLQKRSRNQGGLTTAELCTRVGMPFHADSAE
jgi:hypothetical protein